MEQPAHWLHIREDDMSFPSASLAYFIVDNLWKRNRIFCSSDYDESLKFLSQYLPFQIHEYRTSEPNKGWVIPPKWDLVKGVICKDGETIFEADNPLKIIALSKSFRGTISRNDLRDHLFYDHRDPDRIPYHFRQMYRPWERDWGFCVTKNFYDSLAPGIYEVEIETKESEGYLRVAEYIKQGDNPEGFAIVAHLDHPGMANDDLSGVAAGVEAFHQLANSKTKFTYRLVLVQELIGSVFYLDTAKKTPAPILESCFVEMVGSNTPLSLQSSHQGKSLLESIVEQKIQKQALPYSKGPFRTVVCNDECVWESHGIPMCTLTRYPYPEYHSDADSMAIISEESLSTAANLIYETIRELDTNILIKRHFDGVFALANPKYNLYIDPGQPAFRDLGLIPNAAKLRSIMDEMPLLPTYSFLTSLADRFQLPIETVNTYLKLWEDKGLISLI